MAVAISPPASMTDINNLNFWDLLWYFIFVLMWDKCSTKCSHAGGRCEWKYKRAKRSDNFNGAEEVQYTKWRLWSFKFALHRQQKHWRKTCHTSYRHTRTHTHARMHARMHAHTHKHTDMHVQYHSHTYIHSETHVDLLEIQTLSRLVLQVEHLIMQILECQMKAVDTPFSLAQEIIESRNISLQTCAVPFFISARRDDIDKTDGAQMNTTLESMCYKSDQWDC